MTDGKINNKEKMLEEKERAVVCKLCHIHYNGSFDKGLENVLFVENIGMKDSVILFALLFAQR